MSWKLKQMMKQILMAEKGTKIFPVGSRTGFALAYPNTYDIGMSNLGLHIIYQQVNMRTDTACERIFLPEQAILSEYVRTNTPLLSVENQLPLYHFELVGFAISFEMDYFNILTMLELGKIPVLAKDRDSRHPLIIIGGPCATFNPEPLADFIDMAVIGEGEEIIHNVLDTYYAARQAGLSRHELLLRMSQIAGVYVPRFYRPLYNASDILHSIERLAPVPEYVHRQWVQDIDLYPGHSVILTENTAFKNKYLVEVARGCGRHCRFCMAGYCYRRPRSRSLEKVKTAVDAAAGYGASVGLMGAAISDYSDIDLLCEYLLNSQTNFSVASLRADSVSNTMFQALVSCGHRTVTIAPEAGSQRLRDVINKGISETDINRAVEMSIRAGIVNIKLYFMIGLPTETMTDIDAIVSLSKQIKTKMLELGSKGKLTLSINPFVPKPFTPFQWLPMAQKTDVEYRLKYVKTELKGVKGINTIAESSKEAYIQAILARGDRRLGQVLLEAQQAGGTKGWQKAWKASGFDEIKYLYRARDHEEVLAWSTLDVGVKNEYLLTELKKSETESYTVPCTAGCTRCGVCGD